MAVLFALTTSRVYHPISVGAVASADPAHWPAALGTHLQLEGYVTYVRREQDGDLHLRLCDSATLSGMDRERCVVAECIPKLMCSRPRIGSRVRVRGIYRYDGEAGHAWAEIHPVEEIKVLR